MIPKFDEIRIEILKLLKEGVVVRAKDLKLPLAKVFNLSQQEIDAEYPSGNGEIFYDRMTWALTYLFKSGLIDRPKMGHYVISSKGIDMISNKSVEEINFFVKKEVNKKSVDKREKKEIIIETEDDEVTPQERFDESFNRIKESIKSEILTTILNKKPQEFEKLVVHLLQAMGYGGKVENSGIVTQFSNDKGIDGIIKEDILGFNHISIQAKRYGLENKVGSQEVQSFVGAVAGTTSKKGVFITTSDFTKGALEYVNSLNGSPKIILINGSKLTEYIYEYGLGLQIEKVFKIKKMDSDYWDSMEDC